MSQDKKRYVLGFMFSRDGERISVIRKQKPDWQKGLLNGIGGKMEDDEAAFEAMIREFEEETGFRQFEWVKCGQMSGKDWIVYCFACHGHLHLLKTMEAEEVLTISAEFRSDMISNLEWLIPMCRYNLMVEKIQFSVKYSNENRP